MELFLSHRVEVKLAANYSGHQNAGIEGIHHHLTPPPITPLCTLQASPHVHLRVREGNELPPRQPRLNHAQVPPTRCRQEQARGGGGEARQRRGTPVQDCQVPKPGLQDSRWPNLPCVTGTCPSTAAGLAAGALQLPSSSSCLVTPGRRFAFSRPLVMRRWSVEVEVECGVRRWSVEVERRGGAWRWSVEVKRGGGVRLPTRPDEGVTL